MLKSSVCRAEHLESQDFLQWLQPMKEGFQYHRKLWEYCYIAQALSERGKLKQGMRGLGFAVGQEPLAAVFVNLGCQVVGTDLDLSIGDKEQPDWAASGCEHASTLEALNNRGICPPDEFSARASFRYVDMNSIPTDLTGFDFVWSSCAIEHVGSLDLSKHAVLNMMRCLKPGGVAVHTTEFNVLSDQKTVETGYNVIWRKSDLIELSDRLREAGHEMTELDLELGTKLADMYVDEIPYKQQPHLKLRLLNYIATSIGIIIEARR
jgi:SAM-dependent methyltransferase